MAGATRPHGPDGASRAVFGADSRQTREIPGFGGRRGARESVEKFASRPKTGLLTQRQTLQPTREAPFVASQLPEIA